MEEQYLHYTPSVAVGGTGWVWSAGLPEGYSYKLLGYHFSRIDGTFDSTMVGVDMKNSSGAFGVDQYTAEASARAALLNQAVTLKAGDKIGIYVSAFTLAGNYGFQAILIRVKL